MENNCSSCNWWGVAFNGKLCPYCGKRGNYVPPQTNPFPTMQEVWEVGPGTMDEKPDAGGVLCVKCKKPVRDSKGRFVK